MAEDEDIIRQAEINAALIQRLESELDEMLNQDTIRDVTSVPVELGGHPDGMPALTYDMLQALLQKVYDEPYRVPIRYEYKPLVYDTNNPFHYIQRYGMTPAVRPKPYITITGRTLSRAEAQAAMELGMRRAEALLSRIAGDSVSDVISRDETGGFTVEENETAEPVQEAASEAESEAQAVNLNPQ